MDELELGLWCCLEGDRSCFQVSILSSQTIHDLKGRIYIKAGNFFARARCNARDLTLTKVDVDLDSVEKTISAGRYRPTLHEPLRARMKISDVWNEQPPDQHLHVFVSLPGGIGRPMLVHNGVEQFGRVDPLEDYKDIFVKVNKRGMFEPSDIERNQIQDALSMPIPDFVTSFEQKLIRKPRLRPDMYGVLRVFDIPGSYFEPPEDSIAGDESHEETRYAELSEVLHTIHLSICNWKKAWQSVGLDKCPLKGQMANTIFFYPLFLSPKKNKTATVLLEENWPITVLVKCEGKGVKPAVVHHEYRPRSDFLISNSALPRLLVEVGSALGNSDIDIIRMLTMGAFIVRFANRFLSAFCQERNFVLCAFYIWDNGTATRYTLFQQQTKNDEVVYYNIETLSLNDSDGRIGFVRHLYNLLCVELDQEQDQDTKLAIGKLHRRIKNYSMESMYTSDVIGSNGRKRASTGNCNCTDGGGGDGHAQLSAHGYEVNPEVVVDASSGEWGPIFGTPDHILTVYRPMDSNEQFIAKKFREDSNELEVLRLLDTIPLKSDHVISLIDSFHGWAILPKMATIRYYIEFAPNIFESKVSQVCLALVKGLAYLHEHRIAHRDIKPDNLFVDKNFCLKIIDFDNAMQVEDEDEEVDDQCGTENWMAPEVEQKLRHSPIKADRWACGRVVLFLLGKFGKGDEYLGVFARNLVAHNPNQRPSLLGLV